MTPFIKLIHDWQDLVGAFLGPFLAIILSGIGFLISRKIIKNSESREALRKIEVNSTYTINSTLTMQKKLQYFVASAKQLVDFITKIQNSQEFALQTTNFPGLGEIHLFKEAPDLHIKSYYLHNKLLWAHSGTKDINSILATFPQGWENVLNRNQKFVDLEITKKIPSPVAQRKQYIENIDLFAGALKKFAEEELPKGIKLLAQIKIYNDLARKRYPIGRLNVWWYEGISFKYFRNLKEMRECYRNLDKVDEIDKIIQKRVDDFMLDMKKREAKLETNS